MRSIDASSVLSPNALRGHACVLAFVSDFSVSEVEPLRAPIRRLGGTALVVITASRIFRFGTDDDVDSFPDEGIALSEPKRVARYFGIDFDDDPRASGLFVIDGEGVARLQHVGSAASLSEAFERGVRGWANPRVSRRDLVTATLTSGLAIAAGACGPAPPPKTQENNPIAHATPAPAATEVDVTFEVNGQSRMLHIEPRVTLLDALRERLSLTGTKMGCDMGQCGACTVLVDGRRVLSCLTLAVMVDGKKITTIEGLANGAALHPMQSAFASEDAFQCGFCTPGQIMSAVGLVSEGHAQTDDDVREAMSGNICRCGAYPNIVRAVQLARKGA